MQVNERWAAFSQRMTYEGSLHVGATSFDGDSQALALLNERNAHVLRAVASLEERRVEHGDEDTPLFQELQRMDSKINVLLDIVDRLLLPAHLLPPRQAVRFNAFGAVVPAGLPPVGDTFLLRLHIDACRAMPLELAARTGEQLNDGTTFVYFFGSSEIVEDGLERFVFCHHRRKVAEARLSVGMETVPAAKHEM